MCLRVYVFRVCVHAITHSQDYLSIPDDDSHERRMDGRTDGQTDRQTDRQTECVYVCSMYVCMHA